MSLTIGIASYGNPDGLRQTLQKLKENTHSDWTLLIVNNVHPDAGVQAGVESVIEQEWDGRFELYHPGGNLGYVGAVNYILAAAKTEYIAYCDNDAFPMTPGWNTTMKSLLDRYHEIGMLFADAGHAMINRGQYREILWGVGCFWMLSRAVAREVGPFDDKIGHHEEVDYQTRVRLAGYKIAACPGIMVYHAGHASSDPAAQERIRNGVIAWMNKWCTYFGGKQLNYFSTNVLRHEDWPTSALHMEEYFKSHLPGLNANPETVFVEGVEYDLIKVPRLKGFYRDRII